MINVGQAICILSSLFLQTIYIESSQIFLFCLSRHGDRSPIYKLPGQPFAKYWEYGYGQLTDAGAKQHFNLGRFIRKNYGELLPESFHKDKFYFRSSDTDRTLMSANSFIQGLYYQKFSLSSHIPPPIHSIQKSSDFLLKMSNRCPAYTVAYNSLLNSEAAGVPVNTFMYLESVFETEFPALFVNRLDNSRLLSTLSKICDSVIVWLSHSELTKPRWLTNDVQWHCHNLMNYKQTVAYSTPKLTHLRGGPLVGHLLDLMEARVEYELNQGEQQIYSGYRHHDSDDEDDVMFPINNAGREHRLALVAYFAHDSTLAAMMSHLGIHYGKVPPLASSLLIELHYDDSADALVENPEEEKSEFSLVFRYRNDSKSNIAHPLWPPACGPQETAESRSYHCPLAELVKAMRGTYAVNPDAECFGETGRLSSAGGNSVGLIISDDDGCRFNQIAFFLLLQIVLILFLLYRSRLFAIRR